MRAVLLLLLWSLAAAAAPRLEVALAVPGMDLALTGESITYDAKSGLTVIQGVPPTLVDSILSSREARLVTAGEAEFVDQRLGIRLPLAGDGADAYARRAGGLNPAAVSLDVQQLDDSPQGLRLRLTATITYLAEQADDFARPTYVQRAVEVERELTFATPTLLLLELRDTVGQRAYGANVQQRAMGQTLEPVRSNVALLLRLLRDGAPSRFPAAEPAVAPPGMVRVLGPQSNVLVPFTPNLTVTGALYNARTAAEGSAVLITRMADPGRVQRVMIPAGPGDATVRATERLQDRDVLRVLAWPLKSASPTAIPGSTAPAASPLDVVPSLPEPTGAAGAMAQAAEPPRQRAADPGADAMRGEDLRAGAERRYELGELRAVAPAAAAAARHAVAVRAMQPAGKAEAQRELLLAGTAWGPYILTAANGSLAGAQDLRAQFADGSVVRVTVVAGQPNSPLVVLRLPAGTPLIDPLPLAPPPAPGDAVVVVGHPYNLLQSVSLTVVGGPRRALAGVADAGLQLDGELALGNAGGPVVDLQGRLVGIAYGNLQTKEPGPAISLAVTAEVARALVQALPTK